jgi:hypothetical protein
MLSSSSRLAVVAAGTLALAGASAFILAKRPFRGGLGEWTPTAGGGMPMQAEAEEHPRTLPLPPPLPLPLF